jgi:branched-chain amino acid transport system ATP-binding protein
MVNLEGPEILSVLDLVTRYGLNTALMDINLVVNKGEIVAVIGANGAGKSTLLKSIVGLCHAYKGRVLFNGMDISKMSTERIVRSGIALVPEGRQVFGPMTVKDNLVLGAYTRLGIGKPREQIETDLENVFNLFPILRERQRQRSATLSGGEQQMLAIGRGLMSEPALLLMDEMSMGLAPLITRQIFQIVQEMNKSGVSILMVEQNARIALQGSHRGYVLDTGRITFSGPSESLLQDEKVISAYLG